MMQVAQNDITVSTEGLAATRVLNQRYAVVPDVQGILRVVSLLGAVARELQPRGPHSNVTYAFNRTGIGINLKDSYSQRRLRSVVERYGKPATSTERSKICGLVKCVNPWKDYQSANQALTVEQLYCQTVEPGDLMGMPYLDNTRLDPNQGGWIIATVTPQGLLFGSKPKVHLDPTAAEAELERLASVSPGTEFVLLKAVKTAVTQTVQTRTFAQ